MKILQWHNLLKNKYSYLLLALILIFLVFSVMGEGETKSLIILFVLLNVTIFVIKTFCCLPKKNFVTHVLIATTAFLVHVLSVVISVTPFNFFLSLTADLFYSLFFIIAILSLSKKIIIAHKITTDVMIGGVALYIIIGILWFFFYKIAYAIDMNSFYFSAQLTKVHHLVYFSFTTLTGL